MKLTITFFFSFLIVTTSYGQNQKVISEIVEEGKTLYQSEMASWYGTDVFSEKFNDKKTQIGGYFSYSDGELTKCVFVTKGEKPKALVTVAFDKTFEVEKAIATNEERALTATEEQYNMLRQKAIELINSDTLFKVYNNTSLNLIPVIRNGQRKVFVLTGPKVNGVVVFGNDYQLLFDENNNVTEKKRLHKNIIPINYSPEEGKEASLAMHSHLPETGDYITSTDICTLMLYEKFAKWKQHIVMSKKYVSIWNCESDELTVLTKEAWDKINDHQKKMKSNAPSN